MSFEERRTHLATALWSALQTTPFAELTLSRLADEAGLESESAGLASMTDLACFAVSQVEEQALAETADDFLDAGDASVQEKLIEGLIHRFECFTPKRQQMQALHMAVMRDLGLGLALLNQLMRSIDRLLELCGDESRGIKRMLRTKGVCAVVLRIRSTWMSDDTPDLAQTLKQIDSELETAREWAVSLRLLSPDEGHPHDAKT